MVSGGCETFRHHDIQECAALVILPPNMTVTKRFATFRYYYLMPVQPRGRFTLTNHWEMNN